MKKIALNALLGMQCIYSCIQDLTASSDVATTDIKTEWGLKLGTGINSTASAWQEPRLFISLKTSKRNLITGNFTPVWAIDLYFQTDEPQVVIPGIKTGSTRLETSSALPMIFGGMTGLGLVKFLSTAPAATGTMAGSTLAASNSPNAMVYLAGITLGGLIGSYTPRFLSYIKSTLDFYCDDPQTSMLVLKYWINSSDDIEETRLFTEATGLSLRDELDTRIARMPSSQLPLDIGRDALFHATIDTIPHIKDAYAKVKRLMVPAFHISGISKAGFVRNWNSFAILASAKCFDIPFRVDPILKHYVDEHMSDEEWELSEYPTYNKVIDRILKAYPRIKREATTFQGNIDQLKTIHNLAVEGSGDRSSRTIMGTSAGGGDVAAIGGDGTMLDPRSAV